MKARFLLLFFSIAAMVFIIACSSGRLTQAIKETKEEITRPEISKLLPWEQEWQSLVNKAKKEEKLIVYDTLGPPVRQALADGFKKSTGIIVEFVSGRGAEISQKLLAERRAGIFIADAYMGGATTIISSLKPAQTLSPLPPLLFLPEILDANLWYKKALPWVDKEKKYILGTAGIPSGFHDYIFLKEQVKEEELASYYDLLKLRWKGKMSIQDPTTAGKGNTWFYAALVFDGIDLDFMKALAQQEPVLTRDNRQQLEWVVRGKHLIAIAGDQTQFQEFKEMGVPLAGKTVKEHKPRMAAHSANIVIIDRAPHPAAASLYLNWYLSKEGQLAFARSYPSQSYRNDVSSEHLAAEQRRNPEIDYSMEWEETLIKKANMIPLAKEVFGRLVQ